MKLLILTFITLFSSYAFSQTKINVEDAAKHVGDTVSVCTKVFGTKYFDKSQMTFLNLGAAYPNSPLTIVIFGKDLPNFKVAPETAYADKDICVTGVIKEFKGKVEIIVSQPSAITFNN